MEKLKSTNTKSQNSFKSAHMLSEFSKVLKQIGTDMETSVELFDAIGEKNDMFKNFELSLDNSNSIETIIDMHNMSKDSIYNYVFRGFAKIFTQNKESFNFIHVGNSSNSDLIFFVSTKSDELKEALTNSEFEYATGDFSEFLKVSFCFLE